MLSARQNLEMQNSWLKDEVKRRGRTLVELAEALGVAPAAVTGIVNGSRRLQAEEVPVLARFLGWPENIIVALFSARDPGPHLRFLRFYLQQPGSDRRLVAQEIGATPEQIDEFLAGKRSEIGKHAAVVQLMELYLDHKIPADLRGSIPDVPSEPAVPNARIAVATLPDRETMRNDVPVFGTAQCGDDGAFLLNTGDPIDWVRRAPGIQHKRDVYAIYVEGDSMLPAYRPGALVYVDPNRKPHNGCDVIVQVPARKDGDGPMCYLKRLVRRTGSAVIVQQFNPEKEISLPLAAILHRVLTLEELLGV